jgi:dienelactone hydrolase
MEAMPMFFNARNPRRRTPWLLALTLVGAFGAVPARGEVNAPGTVQVTFQSATYRDFRQLLSREGPTGTVTVPATLSFPDVVKERYPAVIVVHSVSGYLEANEGQYAAELRKAGFATLIYDSFAARGTTGVALARSGPGLWPSGVADAYAALRLLAAHPRIDGGRIAIVGFSYGGEVAHLTAFEALRSALDAGSARFSAHVAYYPAGVFGAVAEPGAYTGSPVLMLLGEKDDNLPVAKIRDYLAYAKAEGSAAPVDVVTYPDAYHAFTVPNLVTLRFYPEYPSTKKCPLILLGRDRPVLLVEGHTRPFDPADFGACMREAPGYSMVYDAAIRARSGADAMEFLGRNLRAP